LFRYAPQKDRGNRNPLFHIRFCHDFCFALPQKSRQNLRSTLLYQGLTPLAIHIELLSEFSFLPMKKPQTPVYQQQAPNSPTDKALNHPWVCQF